MAEDTRRPKLVVFDLDNTLFDHNHSVQCGIAAVLPAFPSISRFNTLELCSAYSGALKTAEHAAVTGEITWSESEDRLVALFFETFHLPAPSLEEATLFKNLFETAYNSDRRATPGTLETIQALREQGVSAVVVSNGTIENHIHKINAIGLFGMFDYVLTSAVIGAPKPHPLMVKAAMFMVGASCETTWLVGHDETLDVRCAIAANVTPIWYRPESSETRATVDGRDVRVIQRMNQILDLVQE